MHARSSNARAKRACCCRQWHANGAFSKRDKRIAADSICSGVPKARGPNVATDRHPAGPICQPIEIKSKPLSLPPDERMATTTMPVSPSGDLALLEHRRLEPVALQQLVELGAIALREHRRLRDVAVCDLEQADEIVELELLARLLERHQRAR